MAANAENLAQFDKSRMTRGRTGWQGLPRRLWRSFVNWLLKPVPFPGKLDINEDQSESYNKESLPAPGLPNELDERRPPQS
jgi:hypothetical protein